MQKHNRQQCHSKKFKANYSCHLKHFTITAEGREAPIQGVVNFRGHHLYCTDIEGRLSTKARLCATVH